MKFVHPLAVAAALALPGTASAQIKLGSGVDLRIYGVADIMLQHFSAETDAGRQSTTLIDSGGLGSSRLGFLFTKELQNGMTASARLEAGVSLDSGRSASTGGSADRVYGRQAYVSLAGSFGEIRGGRLQGPAYLYVLDFDPAQLGPVGSYGALLTQKSGSPGTPRAVGTDSVGFSINPILRTDNTVHYLSPSLGGFKLQASYAPHERAAGVGNMANVYLKYEAGPFSAGYVVHRVGATRTATLATDDVLEQALGLSYKLPGTVLALSYHHKDKTNQTLDAGGAVSNGEAEKALLLSGISKLWARGDLLYTVGKYFSSLDEKDAVSYSLAYRHYIDPTLALFVGFSHLTQDSQSRIGIGPPSVLSPAAGKSVSSVMTGFNFRF